MFTACYLSCVIIAMGWVASWKRWAPLLAISFVGSWACLGLVTSAGITSLGHVPVFVA